MDVAVNKIFSPSQMGELFVTTGVVGDRFTTAVVVAAADVQPATVTVTLYVPDAARVAVGIDGFVKKRLKAPLTPC